MLLEEKTAIAAWCDNGINMMGVNNHFLIGFKVHSHRQNLCLAFSSGPRNCSKTGLGIYYYYCEETTQY